MITCPALCQCGPVKIGENIPNIEINSIINFRKSTLFIDELKGKYLILDFWSTNCLPCIRAFPILKRTVDKYSRYIEMLPVTYEDKVVVLRLLEHLRDSYSLKIPSATNDRILNSLFPHIATPFYVLIDNYGKVKWFGNAFNEDTLVTQLRADSILNNNNERTKWLNENTIRESNSDTTESLFSMISRLGIQEFAQEVSVDSNIVSCRLLTKYIPLFRGSFGHYTDNSFYVGNASIMFLFQLAYSNGDPFKFSPGWSRVELITSDTLSLNADIEHSKGIEYETWRSEPGHNWNYFIKASSSGLEKKTCYEFMKEDLQEKFPFISASVESKFIPVLVLTRYGKNSPFINSNGKSTMASLFNLIKWRIQNETIIDETGYTGNIDINLEGANFKNIDLLNQKLIKFGLELRKANRKIEILIIRDLRNGS